MLQEITLVKDRVLSDNYFALRNITYDPTREDEEVIRHRREVYDRDNGATILLYNPGKKTAVLIRQFHVATWVNGNEDGQLIETCAGLPGSDEPEACIRKEAIEETGFKVGEVRRLFELYISPGGVTGVTHFFIVQYSDSRRASAGGDAEDEDTEVLELPFTQALEMTRTGEVRGGKAVLLLNYLQLSHPMD